jgi:broad specificity phosphatase PhoE
VFAHHASGADNARLLWRLTAWSCHIRDGHRRARCDDRNQNRRDLVRDVYVVAHPEATHHVEGVVGGWHDSQLTYGEAEGRSQEWLDQRFVPPPATGDRMEHHEGVPGAETKMAFAERIYAAMDDILGRDCEQQIVVTHAFAVTFVLAAWIRMPIETAGYANFRAPSGSITVLHEDDYFHNRQIVSLGETGHLVR